MIVSVKVYVGGSKVGHLRICTFSKKTLASCHLSNKHIMKILTWEGKNANENDIVYQVKKMSQEIQEVRMWWSPHAIKCLG